MSALRLLLITSLVGGERKRICTQLPTFTWARALSSTGQRVIAAQALYRRRFSPGICAQGVLFLGDFLVLSVPGAGGTVQSECMSSDPH